LRTDALGGPVFAAVSLTNQGPVEGEKGWVKWTGTGRIIYSQEGNWAIRLTLNGGRQVASDAIMHIASEDVTVGSRTNALLISLTVAFFIPAILEFREKDQAQSTTKDQDESDDHNDKTKQHEGTIPKKSLKVSPPVRAGHE